MSFFEFSSGFLAIILLANVVVGQDWKDAHATFYGDIKGSTTDQGACGYHTFTQGYGLETTALSDALFHNGATCGACFEIKCVNSASCVKSASSIKVTATNFCPSTTGPSPWCNPPLEHFDLTQPMFIKIAQYKAGIVPVQYRRVSCVKKGGLKFQLTGNPNFLLVLVFNVGGAGDVTGLNMKGTGPNWSTLSRNWGMNWQAKGAWTGQNLSFQVTTSDGKTVQVDDAVPHNWQFGQTFEGSTNF